MKVGHPPLLRPTHIIVFLSVSVNAFYSYMKLEGKDLDGRSDDDFTVLISEFCYVYVFKSIYVS